MNKFTQKDIALFYFKKLEDKPGQWQCSCGSINKQVSSGYCNLVNHIKSKHPSYLLEMETPTKRLLQTSITSFLDNKSLNIFGWLDWIVCDGLPFNFCEQELSRKYAKLKPICLNSFKKYLKLLTKAVEKKLAEDLPPQFAIVIDGWSDSSNHFIGLFACYPSPINKNESKSHLLSFAPLFDGQDLSATAHADFIKQTLDFYSCSLDNVLLIVADNCSTMKKMAKICGKQFVGCASHRFNIAVRNFLNEKNFRISLDKVQKLMVSLSSLKNAAWLKAQGQLSARKRNETRWSSEFEMLKRFRELKDFLLASNRVEIIALMPSYSELLLLDECFATMEDFQSVTLALQAEATTLEEIRLLFDEAILSYPSTATKLSKNSAIVASPVFESALFKIIEGSENLLTEEEKNTVGFLRRKEVREESSLNFKDQNVAERAKKRKLEKQNDKESEYISLSWIPGTTNMVERFFSRVKKCYGDYRKSLLPENLEAQLYLCVNRDLWDEVLLAEIINNNEKSN